MVEGIRELRKKCQPAGDKFWLDRIMRKVSIYVTKLFLVAGISANQATLLSTSLMWLSFIPLMFTQFWYGAFLSGFILMVAYLFDYVDGEVARYRGSRYLGRLLDVASHDMFYVVFVFIGFGLYFRTFQIWYVVAGLSATLSVLMARLHQMRLEYMNISAKVRKENGRAARLAYRLTLANTFLPVLYILSLLDLNAFLLAFYGAYNLIFWLAWFARKGWFNVHDTGKVKEVDVWKEIEKHV